MDRELNKFHLSKFHTPRIIGDTNYWSHDSSAADADVADRVQARALYVHVIFPGRNYDHRELQFRKRHGGCEIEEGIHNADSKSERQDILLVLPAVTHPVHTARRAGQRTIYVYVHENRKQRFPTRPHSHRLRCTVCVYGRYAIEVTIKKVEIANY